MWSYWEIGKEFSEKFGVNNEFYCEWIEMYSLEEFGELVIWCINLFDLFIEDKLEVELEKFEEIFLNIMCFEYMFWDMVYNEVMWLIYE